MQFDATEKINKSIGSSSRKFSGRRKTTICICEMQKRELIQLLENNKIVGNCLQKYYALKTYKNYLKLYFFN